MPTSATISPRTRRRSALAILMAPCIALCTAACGSIDNDNAPRGDSAIKVESCGRTVSLDKAAERVVVIGGGTVDTLFEMGVGDRIIGVVGVHAKPAPKYTEQLGDLPDIGDALPGREALLALQPDLVLVEQGRTLDGEDGTPTVEQLEEAGIAVYITNSSCQQNSVAAKVTDTFAEIENMGTLLGASAGAEAVNKKLQQTLDDVAAAVSDEEPVKVAGITLIGSDLWVNTSGLDVDITKRAGGTNKLFDDPSSEYKILSKEEITVANPEAIIFFPSTEVDDPTGFVRQELPTTNAVKNHRILILNSEMLARTGVRPVHEVEEFARFLHPGAFGQE